eukprot:TRINITY_DN4147_c0_g2_i1.p1 TRINITY_DN4147_c0_g2~~TRINITY_DN4147_c0_g2_i1.p1  ORF type:complete len:203 (-),score=27.05 TRINITY_DN4147_c0_g2_i1:58-666(-)
MHVDKEVHGGPTTWIQISGYMAIFVYVLAECTSYYNVATTNELYCSIEVVLDGLSFFCMAPGAVVLWFKCPGSMCSSSAKAFLSVTSVLCVLYPCYNVLVDSPMYLARYHADQVNHKQYLGFAEGILDATTRRVVAHTVSDWRADMVWMTAYFSVGSLSGILLMYAPRLNSNSFEKPRYQGVTSMDVEAKQPLAGSMTIDQL